MCAGLVQLPADDPMACFLAAMLAATPGDDIISLPVGMSWPGMGSNVLYVRDQYRPLWEAVLERGLGNLRGAAVLGTPGSE
jgi:hypothetical protein